MVAERRGGETYAERDSITATEAPIGISYWRRHLNARPSSKEEDSHLQEYRDVS